MAKHLNIPIPDLSDEELRHRLQPLADRVLPSTSQSTTARVLKRKRRGMEFELPEPVIVELKVRAAQRQISATTLLLEMLRDSGYPVVQSDFVDLRKAPRIIG